MTPAQQQYRNRGSKFDYSSKEYRAWSLIQQRCSNSNNPSYKYYGARGIKMALSWQGHGGFKKFITDLGMAPSPQHSLDRIDSNKNYTKNNCRWATASEQSSNCRRRLIRYNGTARSLMEWARKLNMNYHVLYARLYAYGMSFKTAISKPCKPYRAEPKQTKEYATWAKIKQRCGNKNDGAFALYGGRGIKMHVRWTKSFAAFFADVGPAPSPLHTLDRIDVRKGYVPGNCRWATRKEQASNRRDTVRLEHGGRKLCLMDWSRELKINITTLRFQLKRKTLSEIVTGVCK
jgi:hypothetical protein